MGRNVFDLKGDCGPTICVAILSLRLENASFAVPRSQALATWLTSCSYISSLPLSHTPTHLLSAYFLSLPSSTYILSAEPGLPCLRPPYCYFSPHYTLPQQPQPGHAGSPAGGPDGVLASGPALGSLSLQDGSAALLWPIWPRPVLAPVCDYGPAGRRQSWRWKRCQNAAE